MITKVFSLELNFDPSIRKEAVKAVLHTILFQRVFGIVRPRENQVLDLSYSIVDDEELVRIVDARVEEALRRCENKDPHSSRIMIVVDFSEKKFTKTWFSTTQEEVCWEKWQLLISGPLTASTVVDSSFDQIALNGKQNLSMLIMGIVDLVNNQKEHIPPITSKEKFAFPYKITVNSTSSSVWSSALRNIITPKPLLI